MDEKLEWHEEKSYNNSISYITKDFVIKGFNQHYEIYFSERKNKYSLIQDIEFADEIYLGSYDSVEQAKETAQENFNISVKWLVE